jgi:hypothetical protein
MDPGGWATGLDEREESGAAAVARLLSSVITVVRAGPAARSQVVRCRSQTDPKRDACVLDDPAVGTAGPAHGPDCRDVWLGEHLRGWASVASE